MCQTCWLETRRFQLCSYSGQIYLGYLGVNGV
jgi:hypothetical protein